MGHLLAAHGVGEGAGGEIGVAAVGGGVDIEAVACQHRFSELAMPGLNNMAVDRIAEAGWILQELPGREPLLAFSRGRR